jgi:hypothetical protein
MTALFTSMHVNMLMRILARGRPVSIARNPSDLLDVSKLARRRKCCLDAQAHHICRGPQTRQCSPAVRHLPHTNHASIVL